MTDIILAGATTESEPSNVRFMTLGIVSIDTLIFLSKPTRCGVMGGSGPYAALGARLFLDSRTASTVGLLIRAGSDLPATVEKQFRQWSMTPWIRREPGQQSTLGCLKYREPWLGPRRIHYLTEPLTISPFHLVLTPFIKAAIFHLLGTPRQIEEQVPQILFLRRDQGILETPRFIWEPLPFYCTRESREAHIRAARLVDVFTPNHVEISSLFGVHDPKKFDDPAKFARDQVEVYAQTFVDMGIGPSKNGQVIVRAGEHGSLLASPSVLRWFPPYYDLQRGWLENIDWIAKINDPHGAGDAFIGAFSIGLLETGSLVEAMKYGTVGASFALEQTGFPSLRRSDDEKLELWNSESVWSRLERYNKLLRALRRHPVWSH